MGMQHPEVDLEMEEYELRSPETMSFQDSNNDSAKGNHDVEKMHMWFPKHLKSIALMFVIIGFLFLFDSLMVSMNLQSISAPTISNGIKEEKSSGHMYDRLLNLASSALVEKELKQESSNFWEEPNPEASAWKPCADRKVSRSLGRLEQNNGYIVVSAYGGLNQQRIAICNAVAVASLLNATLVLPRFLYSKVWKDTSQFGDIYQEKHFMKIMKDEVDIVKELPPDLKSVDIKAIGSLGFAHRLGFDPLPFELQVTT
ncbi:GDP-fucose protein O-fucosyltransferase [Trema orientale]|uniref:O-fucosyltransferase family protein n=1 Tax=Trema orientale TaxID=63057 RepID=A0A2P5EP45_TREOI|nr:GDP-fucose protein O-fucosyltransferase [Trema orientale]